jgi:hypothetical protein
MTNIRHFRYENMQGKLVNMLSHPEQRRIR